MFEAEFRKLMRREGYYANDPNDRGGETYCGISRRVHPSWEGWKKIDAYRSLGELHKLRDDPEMRDMLAAFYRRNYWDRVSGDDLANEAAAVAGEAFDAAVNCGRRNASLWLQQSLNVLNDGGKRYPDIIEDGWIGAQTVGAVHWYTESGKPLAVLVKVQNARQANHYYELMRKDPSQERFAFGWLERA